jgi:hypothetical protein
MRDICSEGEAVVVHIRLQAYEGVCIQFRHVVLLRAVVGYMLIVYVERKEGVAHIHLSAYEGVRIQFPGVVILVAVVVYIPILCVERGNGVAYIHPLEYHVACMHFLDEQTQMAG